MLTVDATQLVDRLQRLWSRMDKNEEILDQWTEFLLSLEKADLAEEAIKRHREETTRLSPNIGAVRAHYRLLAGQKARADGKGQPTAKPIWESFRDTLGLPTSTHPYEVVLRYYRRLWLEHAKEREGYRSGLRSECRNRLVASGMAQQTETGWDFSLADKAAESIFSPEFEYDVRWFVDNAPRVSDEQAPVCP